ncbi:MAG: preprotein translocase subunit YajC [Endomicrobium sp.]|jgi:preprotein translocase subunit YajC|nr:preprotein translocase subunit YajC [Endomicrobium sp.]
MKRFVNLFVVLVVVFMMPSLAFAQLSSAGLSSLGGLLPLVFIFIFFYLFLLRPQQKKAKEHRNLLNSLKKDDRVITAGGMYATVSSVKGSVVEVKVSDGVCVKVAKQSISAVIEKKEKEMAKEHDVIKK